MKNGARRATEGEADVGDDRGGSMVLSKGRKNVIEIISIVLDVLELDEAVGKR